MVSNITIGQALEMERFEQIQAPRLILFTFNNSRDEPTPTRSSMRHGIAAVLHGNNLSDQSQYSDTSLES